jgi:beta-lactam-binding protein with PASTA domain
MGLKPILNPPHVTLCQDTSKAILANQISPQVTGTQSNIESQLNPIESSTYLYNITLPNGTELTGMTYDQLQKYLTNNKDIYFNFDF